MRTLYSALICQVTALTLLRADLVLTGFSEGWGELINCVFVSYWIEDAKKALFSRSWLEFVSLWVTDTYSSEWLEQLLLAELPWAAGAIVPPTSFHTCRIRKGNYSVNSNSSECRAWALGPGCLGLNPSFIYSLYSICASLSFSVQQGKSTYLIGDLKWLSLVLHLKYFEQYLTQKHSSVTYTHIYCCY